MHSYGHNDADATLASDDEHVKLHAHKGINSDTLACAVEHSIIIDVNLASMDKYLCRTEGTQGYFSARSPFLRNITKRVILGLYLFYEMFLRRIMWVNLVPQRC